MGDTIRPELQTAGTDSASFRAISQVISVTGVYQDQSGSWTKGLFSPAINWFFAVKVQLLNVRLASYPLAKVAIDEHISYRRLQRNDSGRGRWRESDCSRIPFGECRLSGAVWVDVRRGT